MHLPYLRGLTGALLALLLLSPTAAAQKPVEQTLPANALAFLELSGDPCHAVSSELALSKIWNEPEVREFVQPLAAMSQPFLGMARMQLQGMGFGPEAIEAILRGRFTLSFYGMDVSDTPYEFEVNDETIQGTRHDVIPQLVLSFEYYGEEVGVVHDIVHSAEELLGQQDDFARESVEVHGEPVQRLFPTRGASAAEFFYFVKNDRLILTTNRALVEGVIQRMNGAALPNLAADPSFQQARKQVHREKSVLFAYSPLLKLVGMVAEMADDSDLNGLATVFPYRTLAYGMDLDGPGIRDRIFYSIAPGSPFAGLLARFHGPLKTPDMLPASAAAFSAMQIPLVETFDATVAFLRGIDEGAGREIDRGLADIRKELGMDLRNDLLASLGPELCVFVDFPGRAQVPDVGVLLQVQNSEKVESIFSGLWGRISRGHDSELPYMGHVLHVGAIEERHMNAFLRPTWTVADGYLLITLWPQAAKNFIAARKAGGATVAERPDYASLAAGLDGADADRAGSLCYVDLAAAAGWALDNGVPFLQTFVPDIPQVNLRPAAWPRTEVVTRHLFGMIAACEAKEDGIYAEYYSPTGIMLPAAVMVTGAMVPRRMHRMGSVPMPVAPEEGW